MLAYFCSVSWCGIILHTMMALWMMSKIALSACIWSPVYVFLLRRDPAPQPYLLLFAQASGASGGNCRAQQLVTRPTPCAAPRWFRSNLVNVRAAALAGNGYSHFRAPAAAAIPYNLFAPALAPRRCAAGWRSRLERGRPSRCRSLPF